MPDLVTDGALHRSRRRFRLILSVAVAAFLFGIAAFTYSLLASSSLSHQALTDAQAATRRATAAAARAETAATHADQAHRQAETALRQSQVTRAALCAFLAGAMRDAPAEPSADARELARAFHCPTPGG